MIKNKTMKPTLNEQIGMDQKGIEYVNSLEVKDPAFECSHETAMKAIKNDLPTITEIEKQRIKKQTQKVWALVFFAIIIIVTLIVNHKI